MACEYGLGGRTGPQGIGGRCRMKAVFGDVFGAKGQVDVEHFTGRVVGAERVQQRAQLTSAQAKIPAQGLGQCRKVLHGGQAGQQHVADAEAPGERLDQVPLLAHPAGVAGTRGDVIDPDGSQRHIEGFRGLREQMCDDLGGGIAGARHETPLDGEVLAEVAEQLPGEGVFLAGRTDPGRRRVAQNQDAQPGPLAAAPMALSVGFGKAGDGAPYPLPLGVKQGPQTQCGQRVFHAGVS